MAETVGLIASVIGIVDCAVKLRGLWAEVQEVPGKINALKDQVGHLDAILKTVEGQHVATVHAQPGLGTVQNNSENPIITYCRKALKVLKDAVDSLSLEIDRARGSRPRRGVAKLKVVLKKERLAELQSRVDEAFRQLQLFLSILQVTQSQQQSDQLAVVSSKMLEFT